MHLIVGWWQTLPKLRLIAFTAGNFSNMLENLSETWSVLPFCWKEITENVFIFIISLCELHNAEVVPGSTKDYPVSQSLLCSMRSASFTPAESSHLQTGWCSGFILELQSTHMHYSWITARNHLKLWDSTQEVLCICLSSHIFPINADHMEITEPQLLYSFWRCDFACLVIQWLGIQMCIWILSAVYIQLHG